MSFGIALSVRSRVRECTPALFNQVVDSEQTARVCAEIKDALEKVKRGEMSREDFETFKAEQKKRLAIFTPHATFPKGRRVNEDAVPSGLSMYDVDHIKSPSSLTPGSLTPSPSPKGEGSGYSHGQGVRLFQRLVEHTLGKQAIVDEGMKAELRRLGICLVHVTPSTEGFRLFFAVPEGMSLEEAQRWMSEQLGDADYDGCVKDLARCSFAVPRDYILYMDEDGLFKSLTQNSLTPSPSIPSEARPPVAFPKGEGSGYSHGMNEVQGNSQENYLLPSPSGEGQGVRLGASYFCDTLEPTWRDYAGGARKVNGCSAIPEGRYAVVITWSPKFKEWLPLLLGDAEFRRCWSGIRIHAGNTPGDTAGCILVGENKAVGKVYKFPGKWKRK